MPRLTVRRATDVTTFRALVQGQELDRIYRLDRTLTRGFTVVRRCRGAARGWSPMTDTQLGAPEQAPSGAPAAATVAARRPLRARLRSHWAQPFYRNAYSLMLHTGLTAGLGAAYWAVAATMYGDEDVGRGSATISLMTLLSGAVAFNLMGTLTRFIGDTGPRVVRFTAGVFGGTVVVVAGLSGLFLLTLERWGPAYAHLAGDAVGWWFTGAVVVGALVALQDGVLVGLRRSVWVLVLGAVFNVAKLVLLLVLASTYPATASGWRGSRPWSP